jgi:adenylate cyclase
MLSTLLGDGVELDPLKRMVIERTEGNPFFIEEMVQTLFDQGALVRDGAVKVGRSLSQLRLPPTVQGILAARIDRLAREQKDLLQTLAVMGRESPLALIRQVASHGGRATGTDALGLASGRVHLRTARSRRGRIHLQARPHPRCRLQLVADRAPQNPA